MKFSKKPQKFTLITAIIVAIFGAISALAVWQLTDREELINEPEPVQKSTEQESVKKPDPKPEPEMISLPGADPIPKAPGNYTDDDHLWRLVNKSKPFNELAYAPNLSLVTVATQAGRGSDERSIRPEAMPDLEKMFNAAATAGHTLQVGSGYRSYATQTAVFNRYVSQVGEAEARTFSSPPGHSEHQSGLTVDISSADMACWLETCFGQQPAGIWLAKNAHLYGFILRYPEGKESITGYQYEPWHFRYVGTDLAGALYQSGLTLEEAQPQLTAAMEGR